MHQDGRQTNSHQTGQSYNLKELKPQKNSKLSTDNENKRLPVSLNVEAHLIHIRNKGPCDVGV